MKSSPSRRASLLLWLLLLLFAATSANGQGRLLWRNGDALPGELLGVRNGEVTWKSSLFVQPLRLKINALTKISVQRADAAVSKEPWRITMHNGDVYFGTLKTIKAGDVTIASKRHGQIILHRNKIQSIMRMNNPSLIYQGPNNLLGWNTYDEGSDGPNWAKTSRGALATRTKDAQLFRKMPVQNQVALEVELESTRQLYFQLALSDRPTQSPRLEVWDNELVAAFGDDFEPILTLTPRDRKISLQLFWDDKTGLFSVFDTAGKRLGVIKAKRPGGSSFGLYLRNQGSNLTLNRIRVRKWAGEQPKPVRAGQTRVHSLDGTIAYGKVTSLTENGQLTVQVNQKTSQLALAKVERMVFETQRAGRATANKANIGFADGGSITGDIIKIVDGTATVRTDSSSQAIVCDLSLMSNVRFAVPSGVVSTGSPQFRMFCDDGILRGDLVGGGTSSSAIHWLPSGGVAAVAIAPKCKARITRMVKAPAAAAIEAKYPDRLFLISREMIPCRVRTVDEKFVHLETPVSSIKRVAADQVKAVEFGTSFGNAKLGFKDPAWEILKGKDVKKMVRSIVLKPGEVIGHRTLLTGNRIKFKARLGRGRLRYGQMIINIGLRDLNSRAAAAGIRFFFQNNRVSVYPANNNNRFGGGIRSGSASIRNSEADIEIVIKGTLINCKVNGRNVFGMTATRDKIGGRGFVVNNTGYPNQVQNSPPVTISKLEVDGDRLPGQFVQEEAKLAALTTPRFRRENPSEHVLIAPNSDLLRGRLKAVTENNVIFQSRLDDFRFQRSQISSIVWLHPKAKPKPQFVDARQPWVRAILTQGQIINVLPTQMTAKELVGKSPVLKTCRLVFDSIRELHVGGYGTVDDKALYADWLVRAAPEPKFPGVEGDGAGGDPGGPLVGTAPEDFELTLLKGGKFRLSEQEGKIVVLDFWATWCAPCVRAMPKYIDVVKKYDGKKVLFVGVNQAEKSMRVQQFLKRKGWKFQVAMDDTKRVAGQFAVSGIPHTVVIGPDGKIAWAKVGYRPGAEQQLKKAIDDLLAKAKPLPKKK